MSKTFSISENKARSLFYPGISFNWRGKQFTIIKSGKPKPQSAGGEPKTDIFILAKDEDSNLEELKISFKKANYDFLENKISLDRAKEILGSTAPEIIFNATSKIRESFENEFLVFINKRGNTQAGSITLGWKFELFWRKCGLKSTQMDLNNKQKIEIFSGQNLSDRIKNSIVNNEIIPNSGIANYIYVESLESVSSCQEMLNNLIDIEFYAVKQDIYFACKALNYRINGNKWDGNRPLAVYVDWTLKDRKLYHALIFDNPLETKGRQLGMKMRDIISKLLITDSNFKSIEKHIFDTKVCFKRI